MPLWARGAVGSVLTSTGSGSACRAFVIQVFVPLTT